MFGALNKETTSSIKEDLTRLKGDLGRAAGEVRGNLDVMAHEAGLKARQVYNSTSETTKYELQNVRRKIHEKPVQSSLIALGIGIVLGSMFRR